MCSSSARIANIRNRQARLEPLNLASVQVGRLRSLRQSRLEQQSLAHLGLWNRRRVEWSMLLSPI